MRAIWCPDWNYNGPPCEKREIDTLALMVLPFHAMLWARYVEKLPTQIIDYGMIRMENDRNFLGVYLETI